MRIVVDSSALIAIALSEPESAQFENKISSATEALCSTATVYESGVVLLHRNIRQDTNYALDLANALGLNVKPFDLPLVIVALQAYRRYGKGLGSKAQLNFGDCVSYALAKSLGAPLLYKGDDFAATDIQSAA